MNPRITKSRFENHSNGNKEHTVAEPEQNRELELALKDFKSSMHAWSETEYTRPRHFEQSVRVRSWRVALGWAMGCFLVTASVSGGLMERRHVQEQARMQAAQRAAEQEKLARQQQAAKFTDEELLADVDGDVSRQVPSAMEPLAQMMNDGDSK
jgi:hypothetical protein